MIFIPLLYFIFANSFLVLITKKKFGIVFPFTIMLSSIVLYASGFIFSNLTIGIFLNLMLIPIVLCYLIINRKNKKIILEFKNNYFSQGLFFTIIIGLFFFVYDFKRIFTNWDELAHWGPMVKNLINLNGFYTGPDSSMLSHKDYPPIISLYEMFCVKLSGGSYNETVIETALHMFNFILFLPVISELKEKNKPKILVVLLTVILTYLLTLLFFDVHVKMNTIYIDNTLGLLTAFGIFCVYKFDDFKSFNNSLLLSIILIFILLSKDVGIPLYLVVLLSIVINVFFYRKNYNIKSIVKALVMFAIIPLMFLLSWRIYISQFNIKPELDISALNMNMLKSFIFSSRDPAVRYYYDFTRSTNLSIGLINITYFGGTIVAFVLLCLINIKF